jgi:D-inositol-3-phosphate glycosyltransferase
VHVLLARTSTAVALGAGAVPSPPSLPMTLAQALAGRAQSVSLSRLALGAPPVADDLGDPVPPLAWLVSSAAADVERRTEQDGADVVHCLDLLAGAAALRARARTGARVVVRAHLGERPAGGAWWTAVLRAADQVLVPTPAAAARARAMGVQPSRLGVCPDHALVAHCLSTAAADGSGAGGTGAGGSGLLAALSGPPASAATLHGLVDALRARPKLRLEVAGPGDSRRLLGLATRAGVASRVRHRGPLAAAAVLDLVDRADVVVSTREDPTCALAALVAMHRARAVVGVRSGAASDALVEGVTGRLVAPGRAADLARVLVETTDDRFGRLAWGLAGQDRVLTRFGADGVLAGVERAYALAG